MYDYRYCSSKLLKCHHFDSQLTSFSLKSTRDCNVCFSCEKQHGGLLARHCEHGARGQL